MAKTWVLDTETKGTGANMVPLDRTKRRSSAVEPVLVPRRDVQPRQPELPQPKPPQRFKIVDVMTRQALRQGASAREAVDLLGDVRSIVDVDIYVWDEQRDRWRLLPLSDQRRLLELAHSSELESRA